MDIIALAERLIDETRTVKTAAAVVTEAPSLHPVVRFLKQAAETLRSTPDEPSVTLDAVAKLASAVTGGAVTGGGSPAGIAAPKLPGLQASNLGATAGGGGTSGAYVKAASVANTIRKVAADLRALGDEESSDKTAAHVLNAATTMSLMFGEKTGGHLGSALMGSALGAGTGALFAPEDRRLVGAGTGALVGGVAGGLLTPQIVQGLTEGVGASLRPATDLELLAGAAAPGLIGGTAAGLGSRLDMHDSSKDQPQ